MNVKTKRMASISGIFAQNTEMFGTDIIPQNIGGEQPVRFIITYQTSTAATKLEISLDSGTTFGVLNNDVVITQNAPTELSIMVREGDLINFRCPTAGGCTIVFLRVDQQEGAVE